MPQHISSSYQNLPRKQLILTVFGLQLTLLLAALDQTIVATAMPRIIAELNGFERYAWVTTSYLLASTAILPVFGRLSDMYGRKGLLLFGAIGFVLSSALCGMAGDFPRWLGDGMTQLIIFRGLQGIFSGCIMSLIFTVVGDLFPASERGKYQGLFSAVFALASVVGPALGGWITDSFSWRWIFYVNAPVGLLAVTVLWLSFPSIKSEPHKHGLDVLGVVTLIGWVVPLLLALTWAPLRGFNAPEVIAMIVMAVSVLVVFVFHEARTPEPIVPLSLFSDSLIAVSCVSCLLVGIAMFGAILFVPLYFQSVEGASATEAGSFLTPMMLMITIGSAVCGQLVARTGRYQWAGILGPSLLAIGFFLMANVHAGTRHDQAILFTLVIGTGLGLLMPLYTLAAQNAVKPNLMGVATSLTQFFRTIGGTIGAAVFNSILILQYSRYLAQKLPANTPANIVAAYQNPLKLQGLAAQAGAQSAAEAQLVAAVQFALLHALTAIFMTAALVMVACAILNFFFKDVPLRQKELPPVPESIADGDVVNP